METVDVTPRGPHQGPVFYVASLPYTAREAPGGLRVPPHGSAPRIAEKIVEGSTYIYTHTYINPRVSASRGPDLSAGRDTMAELGK